MATIIRSRVQPSSSRAAALARLKASQKRRKPSTASRLVKLFSYVVLIVGGVVFFGPWAGMVVASFKDIREMFQSPPSWWTDNPTISNYTNFLQSENVGRWFL